MARYGKKAQEKVGQAIHEQKRGELKSGKFGKPVASRKQAIAIGLSKARRAGVKLGAPAKGTASAGTRRKAKQDLRSAGRTTRSKKRRKIPMCFGAVELVSRRSASG